MRSSRGTKFTIVHDAMRYPKTIFHAIDAFIRRVIIEENKRRKKRKPSQPKGAAGGRNGVR